MNYLLVKTSDLNEILSLRCQYMTGPDLQLAIQGLGLKSLGSEQARYLNYVDSLEVGETETLISRFIPDIDFASLHLILSHEFLKTIIQPDQLLTAYQIPASAHVYKTLARSIDWSDSVLKWLLQKKIKPHDLSFLNLLTADQVILLLTNAAQSMMSKSDILKTLELVSELILMKIDSSLIWTTPWNESTLADLTTLRFPLSIKRNPINHVQLRWPKSVSIQTKRIQDKMGFQVQFFVSHPEELKNTLSQLEKMVPDWSEKTDGLTS